MLKSLAAASILKVKLIDIESAGQDSVVLGLKKLGCGADQIVIVSVIQREVYVVVNTPLGQ